MDRKKLIISCQENNVCCSIFSVNVVFIQGRIYVTTCLGENEKKKSIGKIFMKKYQLRKKIS